MRIQELGCSPLVPKEVIGRPVSGSASADLSEKWAFVLDGLLCCCWVVVGKWISWGCEFELLVSDAVGMKLDTGLHSGSFLQRVQVFRPNERIPVPSQIETTQYIFFWGSDRVLASTAPLRREYFAVKENELDVRTISCKWWKMEKLGYSLLDGFCAFYI